MDAHSEEKLAQVHPELAKRVRQLADSLTFPIIVTQGLRTYAQQNALYDQGRTTPGNIVTKAQGGHSMHNFGLAVDVAPTDGMGGIDWNGKDEKWQEILAKAPMCDLAEGAEWRTFPDKPHLYPQEVPANPDDAMRAIYDAGGVQAVWARYLPVDSTT